MSNSLTRRATDFCFPSHCNPSQTMVLLKSMFLWFYGSMFLCFYGSLEVNVNVSWVILDLRWFKFFNIFDEFLHELSICCHFDNNQDVKKLPRQTYSKLPNVPFQSFNSWKNVIVCHTHPFKDLQDLSPTLAKLIIQNTSVVVIHGHFHMTSYLSLFEGNIQKVTIKGQVRGCYNCWLFKRLHCCE